MDSMDDETVSIVVEGHDPMQYEICIRGHLDDRWASRIGGLRIDRNADGTSTLSGSLADQAQLHGALAAIRDLGATLLDLHAVGAAGSARDAAPPEARPALERPLRTERLVLRAATVDDADATWAFRRLDAVNEWLTGRPADIEGYRALFAEPGRLATTLVVELDGGGPVIGDLMLRRRDAWAQRDVAAQATGVEAVLGWVVDPAHSGRGYATEAVRELIRHSFETVGVRRVVADCFVDNVASWRLMERVGMRREGHAVRESLHRSGRWLDTVVYALLADEWTGGL